MNKVILSGHVGVEPTITEKDNLRRASFSLATTKKTKEKEITTWHQIVGFGNIVNAIEHLKPGSHILIEGYLNSSSSEKEDGSKKYYTSVICEYIEFLSKRKDPEQDHEIEE